MLVVGFVCAVVIVGCQRKGPKNVTPILGAPTTAPGPDETPFPPVENPPGVGQGEKPTGKDLPPDPKALPRNLEDFGNMLGNRQKFKEQTVYFDFDRAAVRPSEKSKVEFVATYLKGNPTNKLRVEGHCDERGTEEYNRALGERRALSVREYLINLGIGADRIITISYGEDRPAVQGQDESAWSKNRRGEFVLLLPKPQ